MRRNEYKLQLRYPLFKSLFLKRPLGLDLRALQFHIMLASIVTIAALSALPSVVASPTRRATTFCEQLVVSCAAAGPQAITDPWTIPSCIYGATCFGGSRPVDAFLVAIATERNEPSSAKASLDVPVLTLEVFFLSFKPIICSFTMKTYNTISTGKTVITQQDFIDGVYSKLNATNGPYPDVSFVISSFQRVSIWTQLCDSPGIPWNNFADYFKYSATVNSPGCAPNFTTAVTISQPTISVPSTSITASSVTFIPLPPSSGFTYPYVTVTSTTSLPTSSPPTYPVVTSEISCQKTFETCLRTVNFNLFDIWSVKSCVLAASCFPGDRNVDNLLTAVYIYRTGNVPSTAPKSINQPRFSEAQFRTISSNGRTITSQNWIDGNLPLCQINLIDLILSLAYYGLLSGTSGPWPASADVVVGYFRRIQAWTAFCGSDGIPYQNIADYFQYSSAVSGPNTC